MFGNNWVVSVSFLGRSNLAPMLAGISRGSFTAQKSLGGVTSSVSALNKSMAALRASSLNLGTVISGAFAGIGLAGMSTAISDASKLQQILLSIKNETGATNAQIGGFYNTAFKIANQNAMTPEQGGEMLRTISRLTAGQFDVGKMMTIAPTIADYASKIHFNRPDIGVDEAARTGIQTAHLFQAYQPAKLATLLDSAYRLSGMMAEKPDAALRQMSYYVPLFKALKIGDETSIGMMALLDRAGFRNKVGTNVRALALESLGPLQLTSRAQKGKEDILTQMGLFKNGKFAWNTPNGGMDFFGELGAIGKWAQTQSAAHVPMSKIAQEMVSALGKQGATVGSLFLNPEMPGILDGLRKYLNDPNVGLKAATANHDQSFTFQFSRAAGNLTAVMTELGYPWLTDVTQFFKGLGDNLHGFQAWLHGHRDAEKTIGGVVAGITALASIRFAVGTASLLFAGAKALGMFAAVAPGVGLAARAFTILDGIFLAGFGGRLLSIATKFGVLSAATNVFAGIMGGSAVAGVPVALRAIGASLLAAAGPIALFTASLAALMALTAKPVGSDEGKIRPGGSSKTYGSKSFWETFAKAHGWQAVPQDTRNALHLLHAQDATNRVAISHRERTRDVEHHHHLTLAPVIHVHGGSDPQKTGSIVGARIAHELHKAGLIRNHPVGAGFNNAVPAAH